MRKKMLSAILLLSALAFGACGAETKDNQEVEIQVSATTVNETSIPEAENESVIERTWLDSSLPVEKRVELLLNEMTLEEKAYQMVQSEQAGIDKEKITKTGIGSVLSGGGSAPSTGNTVTDWEEFVNSYKAAALESRLGIPLLYGVDAVHGHNNVYGATVFPHNIGLGAADDEELMDEIAKVTAEEVKATGIQWDFAPCLGNAQDITWGRTYECYSQNTDDIVKLSDNLIAGLQENGVIACAKHYIGEGYTKEGVNQGDVEMTDTEFDELLNSGVIDPYIGAVNAGVLTVMPSYNSIDGVKCHENYHLLTEVLKEELGFKGFVISDYNAIEQCSGKTLKENIALSVNAGVDMLMEPYEWENSAKYIVELVNEGKITEERINDAVSRILYVKFVAGLFEEEIGSESEKALVEKFGSDEHREVARRAVRESLILLKDNKEAREALKSATNIAMEGQAAYDMGRQCGGWTISWQGQAGNITEGTTIILGVYNAVKDHAAVVHSTKGRFPDETDAVIAVFGEMPYAESEGDREEATEICGTDRQMLDALKENLTEDIISVGIVIAGRPIDISDYEDMFDVIIFAGLPGTEGEGIADILFGDYEFTGNLKFAWPY